MDEKQGLYDGQDSLPIPTYEEAISRPSSSQSLGPEYRSQDAERQGLLSGGGHNEGYRIPTVESARSSLDLDGILQSSGANSRSASTEALRRELEQMDIIEPGSEGRHLLTGNRFSKHFTNLGHTLSSIHLPQIPQWVPSWGSVREQIPNLKPNWMILARLFAIVLVIALVYLLFLSNLFRMGPNRTRTIWFDPDVLRNYIYDHIDQGNIRDSVRYMTNYTHVAGTAGGETLARYMEAEFAKHLDDVELERFDVYLNYPKKDGAGREIAVLEGDKVVWQAKLEEDIEESAERKGSQIFHGLSRSGTAQGPLVYANYGAKEDFEHLSREGIDLKGSMVIVRYYGTQADRALKVRAAELAGAVGCIIYSDPAEDGFLQGDVFPDGRFVPEDGVQRGSVAITGWVLGDPLTPGYASFKDEKRREAKDDNPGLNKIPSMPLSWRDAQELLRRLKGHGKKLDDSWGKGGIPDIEWWSGDASSPSVILRNELDEVDRNPIYNVLGRIPGIEQPEKSIIVGNHRDAWCFGAADPNGGTAVLLEVIRIFGELRSIGWKPLRSIVFASWDGEEYNIIGSTEHVEARIDDVRRDAFAYLNIDVAVVGTNFSASSSPILNTALLHVLERVPDRMRNKSMRAILAENGFQFGGLDAGSDHAPFQMLAGCSSLDISFSGPPYPYHSCYDSFEWMDRFGDPGFEYHRTIAIIWALLIIDLADREVLPFDLEAYADAVHGYVSSPPSSSNDQFHLIIAD